MKEEWRDIKGYEGLYQVSNLGRVKSLYRITIAEGRCKIRKHKERILKQQFDFNYNMVRLFKNGNSKYFKTHRLVLLHFVDNPYNKKCVNHIDCNKTNNTLSNLEWCTHKENTNHAIQHNLFNGGIQVLMTSKNNVPLLKFDSCNEASEITGIKKTNIYSCLSGERKTTFGYKFQYIK